MRTLSDDGETTTGKYHNFEQNANDDGDDNFEMCEETPISSKTIYKPVVSKRAKPMIREADDVWYTVNKALKYV